MQFHTPAAPALTLLLLLVLLSGCRQQRYIYSAAKINSPVLQKKKDSHLNGSYSFGNARGFGDSSRNRGYDIQAAYAFSNRWAVMASVYKRKESDKIGHYSDFLKIVPFRLSFVRYQRQFWEVGGGYYKPWERDAVFSLYGGLGIGNFLIEDTGLLDSTSYSRRFSAKLMKYFVQPGISCLDYKGFNLNFSLRLSLLSYYNIQSTYTAREAEILRLDRFDTNPLLFAAEPSFSAQWIIPGAEWLRLEGSGAWVCQGTNRNTRFWNLSFGITADPLRAFGK